MAKTMVFIDSRVNDLDLLVSQFAAGTEYKVLDASYDGLLQMQESLAGKYDYSSIQIISHGAPGTITIGSTMLDAGTLTAYTETLSQIGSSLSPPGDILLYGCNVGAGDEGRAFVESVSRLTQADVAASDDVTGATALGGDWVLEVESGGVEDMPMIFNGIDFNQTLGTTQNLNFTVNDASLWNDGEGFVFSHTFDQLVFELDPIHDVSGSPEESIVGNTIGLDYSLDINKLKFGIPIKLGLSAGVFDLNYPVKAQIGLPSTVLHGSDFIVKTSQGVSISPSMVIDGPSIECSADFIFQADISGHLGFNYDLLGLDPMATAIWGTLNEDNTFNDSTLNIDNIVNLYTLALSSPKAVLNQNVNFTKTAEMVEGERALYHNPYFTLGSKIDLNGLDGTATTVLLENESLADFSITLHQKNPMFYIELDVDDTIGALVSTYDPVYGPLISLLDAEYNAKLKELGVDLKTDYKIGLLSLNIMAGLSPALKVTFNVEDIGVTLTANTGESHSGHLGDSFTFSSPSSGTMNITSSYTLEGSLTITPGIYFSVGYNYKILGAEGYVLGLQIPKFFDDGKSEYLFKKLENFYTAEFFPEVLALSHDVAYNVEGTNSFVNWGNTTTSATISIPEIPTYLSVSIIGADGEEQDGISIVNEGNSNTRTVVVHITRSGTISGITTANYQFSYGKGLDDDDFSGELPLDGSITFSEGEAQKEILLNINGDILTEADERLTFTLISNVKVNTPVTTIVIKSDDKVLIQGCGEIYGTIGDDVILGCQDSDNIYAGEGNDTVNVVAVGGHHQSDTIYGGSGTDTLNLDYSSEQENATYLYGYEYKIYNDNATNTLTTLNSSSSLNAIQTALASAVKTVFDGYYTDVITTGFEIINMTGSQTDNLLIYQAGSSYDGQGGTDTFYADWSDKNADVNLINSGTAYIYDGITVTSVERLLLQLGNGTNVIDNTAYTTDDYISTGSGNDTISLGNGSDYIDAGAGNDTANVVAVGGHHQSDTIYGGSGTDTLNLDYSSEQENATYLYGYEYKIYNDNATNTLTTLNSSSSLNAIQTALASAVKTVFDGYYTDVITTGLEIINLKGSQVNNLLIYQSGSSYDGQGGTDTFYADWSDKNADVNLINSGTAYIYDGITVTSVERLLLQLGNGTNVIDNTAYTTDDYISTGSGNDTISLGNGSDYIDAAAGNDTVNVVAVVGHHQSDTIYGGSGTDTLNLDYSSEQENATYLYGYEYKIYNDNATNTLTTLNSSSSLSAIQTALASAVKTVFDGYYTDVITTGFEIINLKGSQVNNLLIYQSGSSYDGQGGTDIFYADWSDKNADVNLINSGTAYIYDGITVTSVERLLLQLGNGTHVIDNTAYTTDDYISTGSGNDTISLGNGSDYIDAGAGNDTVNVVAVVGHHQSDTIYGGSGSGTDTLNLDYSSEQENATYLYGYEYKIYNDNATNTLTTLNSSSSLSAIQTALASAVKTVFDGYYTDVITTGFEIINLKGSQVNNLLIYQSGSSYDGQGGTDTFYADWSEATADITWVNDPIATSQAVNGVTISNVERLLLVTGSGDDKVTNLKVTTNDDISTGAGNDTIDAGGGSDTMIGGLGNDFYAVDSSGDVVTELASEGIDTVQSTISYTLGANLEKLILAGVSAINGTGNAAGNTLVGNSGNNSMSGGKGNDTIYGGEGSDTAIFTGQFVDYVIDYNAGVSAYTVVDKIANRDGTDVISSVENFQFADGTKIMTSSIVDVVAPTASSFTPPDGIDSVAIGSNIVLVFSEAIKSGAGTIAIHSGSATGPVVESYDTATSVNLTISGSMLTIDPTSDLTNGTHYFITFDSGSIKDIAGNSFAGTDTYDFTTAATASLHDLTGSATFWKTGLPITAVTSTLASSPAVTGAQPIEFRNIQTAADGSRTLEIWETSPTAAINSVQLDLSLPTGSTATWQDATDLPFGWNSSPNTDKPGQFILGGIGTTALSAGSVKLGTLTLTAPANPQHFELSLTTGQLGNDTIPAFALSSDSMTTGTDGLYQHLAMTDGTYTLTSAKVSGTDESNAIKANDALAALKIALGMNPNADRSAVSPYQYLAADVNHDGQIKAADALNILKMAVKLSTAPEMEWLFVPESVGSESMSRTHVVWPDNPIPVTLDMDQDVHLIGIVKGDVDGSWAG